MKPLSFSLLFLTLTACYDSSKVPTEATVPQVLDTVATSSSTASITDTALQIAPEVAPITKPTDISNVKQTEKTAVPNIVAGVPKVIPAQTAKNAAPAGLPAPGSKPQPGVPDPQIAKNKPTVPADPITGGGAKPQPPTATYPPKPIEPRSDHAAFDVLLRKNVSSTGKVNYKALKSEKAALEAYIAELNRMPVLPSWPRAEKMAYWINAYNANTLLLIVDNYPLKSINGLDGGKTWDVKRIILGGKSYSLNDIENTILRGQFKDPRIHFAVNCAAKSCPPLLNRAWTASNLESNFEAQAKAFINNPAHNTLSGDRAAVSKIFDWYASDFGYLAAYLNKYATKPLAAKPNIVFKEYDWSLNE